MLFLSDLSHESWDGTNFLKLTSDWGRSVCGGWTKAPVGMVETQVLPGFLQHREVGFFCECPNSGFSSMKVGLQWSLCKHLSKNKHLKASISLLILTNFSHQSWSAAQTPNELPGFWRPEANADTIAIRKREFIQARFIHIVKKWWNQKLHPPSPLLPKQTYWSSPAHPQPP